MSGQSMPQHPSARINGPTTITTAKGIKGLFSRRILSPEPSDPTIRSRLRSFITDSPGKGAHPRPGSTKTSRPDPSARSDRKPNEGRTNTTIKPSEGRERVVRPSSPDQTKRHAIRFGPSLLPAIQKGEDGKWQPPSLSRGSLSLSALALYGRDDEEEDDMMAKGRGTGTDDNGQKHTLAVLFNHKAKKEDLRPKAEQRVTRPQATSPSLPSISRGPDVASKRVQSGNGSGFSWQEVSPPPSPLARQHNRDPGTSPLAPSAAISPSKDKSHDPAVIRQPVSDTPANLQPMKRPRADTSPNPRPPVLASAASPSKVARSVPSSPTVRSGASTPQANSVAPLSQDHYHLRLATTYLIRILTPFIRGSGFVMNDKMLDMKRHADEHVSALNRIEKGWGGDWTRVAGNIGVVSSGKDANESKVRALHVSDRTKAKERQVWTDVLRDGILLCLLLNQLFPSNPQYITRVNISEDGILRATNLTRFHTACQKVGLAEPDIFGLSDLQEADEQGMGRVAWTILALAQHAGRQQAAIQPKNRASDSAEILKSDSSRSGPRLSPQNALLREAPPKTKVADNTATSSVPPVAKENLQKGSPVKGIDEAKPIHPIPDRATGLSINTLIASPTVDDPAFRTPTTTSFDGKIGDHLVSPRRGALPRAVPQPNMSPIRSKSPSSTGSPSRVGGLASRSLVGAGRSTLRPRYTTGSKIQVSFAEGSEQPPSPRNGTTEKSSASSSRKANGFHIRERTPSLISSGSRVTSGYTRSSAAMSVTTVSGDDFATIGDFDDPDTDGYHSARIRERRMSEKTLQNARQKILGTLLSSDDLPEDLRKVLELQSPDDPRHVAISQSLAALEGYKTDSHRLSIDSSPRRTLSRPVSRGGGVGRVAEEDEISSNGGSVLEGRKPSIIRRTSANGKVYVPKRSNSPSIREVATSPVRSVPFPTSNSLQPSSVAMGQSVSADRAVVQPPSQMERRQSDGLSYVGSSTRSDDGRPGMAPRNASMVNLSQIGAPSSILRENLMRAGQRQPLQILEVNEAGFPPVKYQVGNCVGRGQFGAVYRSLNLSTGQMVAIKRIKLDGIESEQVEDVMHEVELLKKLAHPSIVRYEGMSRDEEYLNIVLEYIENGSLVQTLKSFGRFNERLCSSYVAKILEGLDYLHSQGVVHCDLKAANILSTKNGNVKLSDFGVSLTMKAVENLQQGSGSLIGDHTPRKTAKESIQGSPNWMAPEVINLQGATTASDIWSLGCTIIELLTGQPPYSDLPNSMAVLWHIVMDTEPPIPPSITSDLRDFLELCFIKDPSARPAAVVLFEHPWIKKLNPDLALRPQDSVPFLRRVSMDLRRVDSAKLFPTENSGLPMTRMRLSSEIAGEGTSKNRLSIASSHGREGSDGPMKEHALIKTTFGKAILCRVCHFSVKKAGVLCHACGLICHSACATKVAGRCDVSEQLALLTRQQEYLAAHPNHQGRSAASSCRQSFDGDELDFSSPFTNLPGKILHGLKRNRSGLRSSTDLAGARSRRSSSNFHVAGGPETYGIRPSLDVTRNSNSHSRASVFTDASITSDIDQDGRRRSAIRFELADEPPKVKDSDKIDTAVDVVSTNHRPKYKGHKTKDSKSDCAVM